MLQIMSEDVIVQYTGPYTIQSSDSANIPPIAESESISIDRNTIRKNEYFVVQDFRLANYLD